ncbi:hypothetical protein SANTM175S_04585 [Streptomyces antimycoticus]
MHDLGVDAVPLGEAGAQGERPGGVDLRAEGGVDHHPPVAQLVAEPLHHDRAVVRHMPAGTALLVQISDDVLGGPGVQTCGQQPQAGVLGLQRADLAQERAQGTAKLQGAAEL